MNFPVTFDTKSFQLKTTTVRDGDIGKKKKKTSYSNLLGCTNIKLFFYFQYDSGIHDGGTRIAGPEDDHPVENFVFYLFFFNFY